MIRKGAFRVVVGWLLYGCTNRAVIRPRDLERRPDMETLLRERETFFAADSNVGAASSSASTTRVKALPRAGAIATKRVTRIEAIAFNRKFGKGPACAPEEEPFAPDGRLCGDVRLPVSTLTEGESASVLRLLDDAENTYGPKAARNGHYRKRPVVRCDFDPHHAFALYDDAGRLLGTIAICMTCHQWLVHPSSPGTGEGRVVSFEEPERATLASILNGHGLGAWIFDDADPRGADVSAYERAVYGTEEEPTLRGVARRRRRLEANGSGVERTKKLDELTRAERDALCIWTAESVRPGRRNGNSHGYECVGGTTWIASYGEKDCGVRPLECSAPVGELEACLRELREPEDLCGAPPAPCQSLMQCLPGLAARAAR
jgi:hypothetical protein